jgi:hypothetical protein
VSKYAIAQDLMGQAKEAASQGGVDETDVLEALLVLAIQQIAKSRGADPTRNFLEYEMSSIRAGGVVDVAKQG